MTRGWYAAILLVMAKASSRPRPGGHELRPEVVARFQRERILRGAAAAVADRGYRETSVADIVKSAAIARARFYENFASKEDCFFVLYDQQAERVHDLVLEACRGTGDADLRSRVRAGLQAVLEHVWSEREAARAIVVEGPASGARVGKHFERLLGGFVSLLQEARRDVETPERAATVEETVVGGLYWMLYYALLDQDLEREPLLEQMVDFTLVPLLGPEAGRN